MVCLGNICRSPMAEGVLRKKLSEKGIEAEVDSAGTSNYHVGEKPDERAIACAARHGVDLKSLRARQFRPEDFDRFDRIFVMDLANYSDVISLARTPADREKVDLLLHVSFPDTNMEVPDPYFGGDSGFEKVYLLLDNACGLLAEGIQKTSKL